MAYRRSETLGDLVEHGFRLLVGCKNCGSMRAIRPASLYPRVSPARRWSALRFRCTRCGARDVLCGIDADMPR
jgi:hypothetical protein